MRPTRFLVLLAILISVIGLRARAAGAISVDVTGYDGACGVVMRSTASQILLQWPIGERERGELVLNVDPLLPLIDRLGEEGRPILTEMDPVFLLTVGTRDLNLPSGWVAFFDDPPKRPHKTYRMMRDAKTVKVTSEGRHCSVVFDGVSAGSFKGELRFTVYPQSRLIQVQAVVSTTEDSRAILYDTGLVQKSPSWKAISFLDSRDHWQHVPVDLVSIAKPEAVRNRAIIAEGESGSVAIFPPPHQYFYPLDFVDNFGFTWHEKGYHDLVDEFGFGIRQPPEGDRRHVPWINAPPNTQQKLGVFYLISPGNAEQTLEEVRKFTRGDRFKHLDGYQTFTSHYHIEHTLDFLEQQKKQNTTGIPVGLEEPAFVKRFKSTGVDIAHLAEFHMGWTKEQTAHRLDMMKTMYDECRRLSGDRFLLLPGEEPDVHLGGHWLDLFPKPVYWTLERGKGQAFKEDVAGFGTVYHTGDSEDVLKMMEAERGLMWTAHPRIKGSFGFPDVYRNKDFFLSDRFLGGAWKAMPADDSLPRLGTRVLDLMDDMANWGLQKVVIGEVDAFKVHMDSELYGHININYLKLDKIPRYDDGWEPVLDALRAGKLFVTTGEVLIPQCTISGKSGGETLAIESDGKAVLKAQLEWTFPLSFAEVISGDGKLVYRQRIDLSKTAAFDHMTLEIPVELKGRKWARFEVWDIATDGAFTEPVWIN